MTGKGSNKGKMVVGSRGAPQLRGGPPATLICQVRRAPDLRTVTFSKEVTDEASVTNRGFPLTLTLSPRGEGTCPQQSCGPPARLWQIIPLSPPFTKGDCLEFPLSMVFDYLLDT